MTAIFSVMIARANNTIPGNPSERDTRNDEINGVVLHSENKRPLRDVSITAYSNSTKKEKTIQTDESGTYFFDELKPGTYKFVFEKTGYKKQVKDKVVIKTNEAFQLNIEMIESHMIEIMPSPLHFSDF